MEATVRTHPEGSRWSNDHGVGTVIGMNDGKPDAIEVFLSTRGEICLEQTDVEGEEAVVAIRPRHVPAVIEQLRQCLAKYEEMIREDPRAFEGEEQLRLGVG